VDAAGRDDDLEPLVQELEEARAAQQALLAALPDLMFRLHRDGTYLEFAGDLSRLATPAGELVGSNIHDILPREVAQALMGCAAEALSTNELRVVEYDLQTLDGEESTFEARVVPAGAEEVVAVVRDVTERNRAYRELRDSRARIVSAADRERKRIERNLHDGAQQQLVTARLHLHGLTRLLGDAPQRVRDALEVVESELSAGIVGIRAIVRGLHPSGLADAGLAGALRQLVLHAAVPVSLDVSAERLPAELEAAAFYTVAEAIANASKHARATEIRVTGAVAGPSYRVAIVDDGQGGAAIADGGGLQGLRDRVEAVDGSFELTSGSDGTTVVAIFPLDKAKG
jgi:PAS domain S-box-containing protein